MQPNETGDEPLPTIRVRNAREIVLDLLTEVLGWDGADDQPDWQVDFANEFVNRALSERSL